MTNAFESEFGKSMRLYVEKNRGVFGFRLPDTKAFRAVSEKICMIKVPCDYILIRQGRIYLLELKSSKNTASFSYSYIKDHQMESLLSAEDAGHFYLVHKGHPVKVQTAYSYFLINNRSHARNYKCYVTQASVLNATITSSDKKSIKWEELEALSFQIKREGELWNVNDLFQLNQV